MISTRKFATGLGAALFASLFLIAGCQKEGPAERAGKQVDQAVDKVGQKIEKAGDNIQDATKGNKQ